MPTPIEALVLSLDQEIRFPSARVALVSDKGARDESSIVGTRDGYLCLARSLLQFVLAADEGLADQTARGVHMEALNGNQDVWSDVIAQRFYVLPSFHETAIVGTYLCKDHKAVIEQMKSLLGGHCHDWEADPQFAEPDKAH